MKNRSVSYRISPSAGLKPQPLFSEFWGASKLAKKMPLSPARCAENSLYKRVLVALNRSPDWHVTSSIRHLDFMKINILTKCLDSWIKTVP